MRRRKSRREPRNNLRLQPRDMEILRCLKDYRYLTSSQIAERFFGQKSACDRRMRKLYDQGLVERIERPVAQGKMELIYTLYSKGADLLAQELGVTKGELGWSKRWINPTELYLEHELLITSFHFELEQAILKKDGYQLEQWSHWEKLKTVDRSIPVGRRKVELIPDAYFTIKTPEGIADFFLEADRGTEPVDRFLRKLQAYQTYWDRGEFKREFGGEIFRVLTVTVSENRLHSLVKAARKIDQASLFWFTTVNACLQETIFERVWLTAEEPEQLHVL